MLPPLFFQHTYYIQLKHYILIERNLRLVVYIAKKYENSGVNIEDLISIGTIGLMKAINSYNLEKNIKLATYASRCIENEILMYLRKNNKIKTNSIMNRIGIEELNIRKNRREDMISMKTFMFPDILKSI